MCIHTHREREAYCIQRPERVVLEVTCLLLALSTYFHETGPLSLKQTLTSAPRLTGQQALETHRSLPHPVLGHKLTQACLAFHMGAGNSNSRLACVGRECSYHLSHLWAHRPSSKPHVPRISHLQVRNQGAVPNVGNRSHPVSLLKYDKVSINLDREDDNTRQLNILF